MSQDREKLKREEGRTIGAVKEISDLLQLPLTGTARIEAYDISNINGLENVGSMVVYEKGKPKRSDYRKFKIKSVSGPDDYACMREVLTRRFRHGMEAVSYTHLDVYKRQADGLGNDHGIMDPAGAGQHAQGDTDNDRVRDDPF